MAASGTEYATVDNRITQWRQSEIMIGAIVRDARFRSVAIEAIATRRLLRIEAALAPATEGQRRTGRLYPTPRQQNTDQNRVGRVVQHDVCCLGTCGEWDMQGTCTCCARRKEMSITQKLSFCAKQQTASARSAQVISASRKTRMQHKAARDCAHHHTAQATTTNKSKKLQKNYTREMVIAK